MRIVILGANGQIGKIIFDAARKNFPQAEILACVRAKHLHFEGVAGNKKQHSIVFDPFQKDWSPLGKPDWIINCIGVIDEREMNFEKTDLLPLFRFGDHFSGTEKPQLIQISVLGARPDSPSAFMRTKSIAEKTALRFPGSYLIRPSVVCTRGTMLVRRIRALKKIAQIFGNRILFPEHILQTEIQPVCPEDLAALLVQLIRSGSPERIIELAGAEKFRIAELLNIAGINPIGIRKKTADRLMKFAVPFLNSLLNAEQYLLLGENNTSENIIAETIIGRKMKSSKLFFEKELSEDRMQQKATTAFTAG